MIYTDAELSDGMYNINNGKLFKYKAKGGSVRVHEIKRLVRCKDCKHRCTFATNETGTATHYYVCDFMDAQYEDEGYCHHGERSEE